MNRDGVQPVWHESSRESSKADVPQLRHVCGAIAPPTAKGKGKAWSEQTVGWSARLVARRRRPSTVGIFDDLADDQLAWSHARPPPGCRVLPRRWVVERTFAWQRQQRRLSTADARRCATSEAGIRLLLIRRMLRRLAHF